MAQMSISGVFVCNIIAIQIELALGFEWMNISRNIVACEQDDVQLIWGYKLLPWEYIKAKSWFTVQTKMAKRIAIWKDTDGLKIEPAYRDRVAVTGDGKDSLSLRGVTTSDEGNYTLLVNFALSPEPDPRFALNLKIYVPPSQTKGYCRPDITATNDELHAVLYSEQGCGKPLPIVNWNITRNKMVRNSSLILGDNDRGGVYKVCLIGQAIARCFKGDEENLCGTYTVQPPQTIEVKSPLPVEVWFGIVCVILVSVLAGVIVNRFTIRFRTGRWTTRRDRYATEESIKLIRTHEDVNLLTKELVRIYKGKSQFGKADCIINLQSKIYDGTYIREADIDINVYRNVFERNEQPLKRILIEGEVGCGKTTWCNTLTQDWRKAHDPNNKESNDNITFLKKYNLLFNVSLAEVHKFAKFKDLLLCLHSFVFDEYNIDIYDYVQKHNTIIIIQGLEESTKDHSAVKNILSDNGLEHAVIIITGTPLILTRYPKETSVDRVIHVQGLKKDDMIKHAEKSLKDDLFSQEMIDKFFESIKSIELEEFTTEPVFFQFLVEMWKINSILPSTRTEFLLAVLDKEIKETFLSLVERVDDYIFSFENNLVLMDKRFIIHCGKIVKFLGEIAVKILIDNKNGVMISKHEFDDIFLKQNLTAEDSYQFIIDFCVSISLVSVASDKEGDIHTISFRHKVMLSLLAALYISTLKEEEKRAIITLIQSSNDLTEFLKFLSQ